MTIMIDAPAEIAVPIPERVLLEILQAAVLVTGMKPDADEAGLEKVRYACNTITAWMRAATSHVDQRRRIQSLHHVMAELADDRNLLASFRSRENGAEDFLANVRTSYFTRAGA